MALVLSDRVKETTTTSGTGSITLGGAVGGFVTFASAIGDGNKTYYVIENDTRWEIGVGTYSSGSLSRDSVLASSIGGGKISLSGVSFVFVSLPASKTNIWNEESGDVNLPATLTLPQVIAHKVTVSGDILSSGLTNFVRTTSGNFFHAYVNDSNKRTLALYTDAASSPQWKLGLKSNPNDVNTPPNYAYIYAEDGDIGLYANSQNYLSLTHGGGFSIVNKSDSIFTSASTTGTSIIGNTAAYPSLIVKAAPAQAADIQQWKNSADSTLVKIENDGSLVVGGSDIATDIRTNSASGVAISGWSNSTLTSVSGYFEAGGAVSGYFQYVTDSIPDATQVSGSLQPQITNNLTSGNINRDYTGSVSGWADTTITQRDNNVSGWVKTHVANQVDQTAIDSGNSNLARISTNITNIALNASGVISSGNLNHSLIGSVSGFYNYKVDTSGNTLLTRMISSGNTNKDYTASVSGWAASSFTGGGGSANSGDVLANSASGVAISGYNQSYTDIKVADLVDSAPATLNTLNEIATALSGDASLAVTLTNKINSSGNKVYDTAVAASLPVGSGAKIQANTSSINSNTTSINASGNTVRDLAIASGNKAHDTSTAASLPVGSGAKIQANASSITTNTSNISTNTSGVSSNTTAINASGNTVRDLAIASGNKAYDTSIAVSLPVGSGAKIQANTASITSNTNLINSSGNKAHDTAVAASLPVGSGAKIQVNAANITSNTNLVNSSGNKAYDTAVAASLAVGSGAKIQVNASNITANTTAINASGNSNRDYTAAVSGWADTTFTGGGGLAVESGAKIQANAANITSNTNLAIASGNKAYDTATAASLAVGSGAKIQANTANISTNATAIIASGNANHASIATNTSNISTNTTAINASGNANKDYSASISGWVDTHVAGQDHTDTTYTAGSGLTLQGDEFNVYGGSGHFIDLVLHNGNIQIGTDSVIYNSGVAIGYKAGSSSTNNLKDVFIGYQAGKSSTPSSSSQNVYIGQDAGSSSSSATSVGVGLNAMKSSANCSNGVGIGYNAFESASWSTNGVAIGNFAGWLSSHYSNSIALGYQSALFASGSHSFHAGSQAGYSNTGGYNIGLGYNALRSSAGSNNVEIVTQGASPSIIGSNSNKIHIENTIVGDTTSHKLAIGNVGSADLTPDATLEIKPNSATDTGLIVQGAAAQSANFQEWKNSSSTVLAKVASDGDISTSGTISASGGLVLNDLVPNSTTNTLYNDGGTLKFNGSAVGGGLAVGSGAKIQANELALIASGNKAYDTAIAASLPVGSGSKIQTNASNITSNTTAINASGNSNKDLITSNTTAINASGNSNKDYTAAVSGYAVAYTDISITDAGGYSNWKIADGTAAGDAISNGETLNVSGVSGVNTDYTGNLLKIAAVGLSGYSQSYTDIKVAALVDSAPDTLNTLNEIAAAIDDDANIATTLTNLIVSSGNANRDLAIASGNKANDTAVASSLPVGSGAKIQANAASITSNTNLVNSSGNKAHDTAVAASLPVASGGKVQDNAGNITSNTNLINSSGNKAYDTAVAASLPVGSGAKIQANAANITSNTNLVNSSGNKAYDTAVAASLPVGSGAKIQVNVGNISTNATDLIASGNKAHDTAVAASLPVGSGSKIQVNAGNITSNTNLINSSGNKAYDTAVAASLAVGSGAKIQANELGLIASGNKAYDTAIAASLPVGSGAKIQANTANISTNATDLIASGNKAHDTATAASLAVGSGAKIQANELALIASGNKAYDTAIAVALTYAISSGNRALEVASGLAGGGGGGSFNNFTLTADGGSNQTIADGNTLDIAGGNGITTAVGATDTVTVNVDAAQTTITSLLATDIKIGEDDQTKIDFEDANQINFYADNVKKFEVKSDGLVASGCIRQLPNTLTDGGAVDIDCSTSNYHEVLMNADATAVNFTNVTAGQRVIVRFKQHSSHIDLNSSEGFNDVNVNGSNATIKWGGGVVPTLTESNNAVDVYGFIFESTVTNVMAFIIAQDVK